MRSYWMSLTLVAVVLCGYSAIVFTSRTANQKAERIANPSEPREPAAAATAATTEASTNVN